MPKNCFSFLENVVSVFPSFLYVSSSESYFSLRPNRGHVYILTHIGKSSKI